MKAIFGAKHQRDFNGKSKCGRSTRKQSVFDSFIRQQGLLKNFTKLQQGDVTNNPRQKVLMDDISSLRKISVLTVT